MNGSSWKLFERQASINAQQPYVQVCRAHIVPPPVCFLWHGEKKNVMFSPHTLFHPCTLGHCRELNLNQQWYENK